MRRYFATLSTGRLVLWCYAIWYVVNVALHFDPRPRLWLTSLGLAGIIGVALILSTRTARGGAPQDRWTLFRLFLMPFCVSSFAALVKDAGFFLIFPPSLWENALGWGAVLGFLVFAAVLRQMEKKG